MRKTYLILCLGLLFIASLPLTLRAAGEKQMMRRTEEDGLIPIGAPEDYPPGTIKPFAKYKIIVFSDEQGLYAISSECTHMKCTLSFRKDEKIFACPCHGSKFTKEGSLLHGPAKKGLAWFFIGADDSGRIYVDKTVEVREGTKYTFNR